MKTKLIVTILDLVPHNSFRYKATVRGINEEDDSEIPEVRKLIDIPTRVVVSDKDAITRAEVAEQSAEIYL